VRKGERWRATESEASRVGSFESFANPFTFRSFEKRLAELENKAVENSGTVVNGVIEEMAKKVVQVESCMLGCSHRVDNLADLVDKHLFGKGPKGVRGGVSGGGAGAGATTFDSTATMALMADIGRIRNEVRQGGGAREGRERNGLA